MKYVYSIFLIFQILFESFRLEFEFDMNPTEVELRIEVFGLPVEEMIEIKHIHEMQTPLGKLGLVIPSYDKL